MYTAFSTFNALSSPAGRFLGRSLLHLSLLLFVVALYPQNVRAGQKGKEEGAYANVSPTEVFRNGQILNKTIKDLESFRLMMKYMGDHKDDSNRLLLMEETERYIDKYATPLMEKESIYHPSTFDLAVALIFFKAFVYLEGGNHGEYLKTIDMAKQKFGKKHLDVRIDSFNDEYKTVGEAIDALKKLQL